MDLIDIDERTIPKRCGGDNRLFTQLTTVDWVVLDFTNGKRSFKDMSIMLPTEQSALLSAYKHLRSLGFITWEQAVSESVGNTTQGGLKLRQHRTNPPVAEPAVRSDKSVLLGIAMADLSDDSCLQYIPPKLLISFRSFAPKLADPTLDIDLGTQALIEFLALNLSSLTPHEILGVTQNSTPAEIRQAYLKRSRQFHPDRYFRKSIGPFQAQLATIFKAVTKAFSALQ